ncbi:MAG: response regulator, partial [Stellaceae bacterium]
MRDLIDHVLQDAGYCIDAVGTAAAALLQIEGHRYDLVVADAKLPDGAGIAIADFAKAHGIPAVILTGYLPETRPGGPQHNYLFKPIRPEEMVRAVA